MKTHRVPSQEDRILAVLEERRGQWVPLPDLITASGAYNVHSRIAGLRKRHGLRIDNKTICHGGNGKNNESFYRLRVTNPFILPWVRPSDGRRSETSAMPT